MPVVVYSKFEEEPIKIECPSMETPFSNYKSMEKKNYAQGHVTPKSVICYGRNLNLSEIQVICKYDEDQIKGEGDSVETRFFPL